MHQVAGIDATLEEGTCTKLIVQFGIFLLLHFTRFGGELKIRIVPHLVDVDGPADIVGDKVVILIIDANVNGPTLRMIRGASAAR